MELHGSKFTCLSCFVIVKRSKPKLEYSLGVSIAVRKYPVTSRTWKSSSLAAKVVPGELGVRIARCTLHFYKKSPQKCGLFCFGGYLFIFAPMVVRHFNSLHFTTALLTMELCKKKSLKFNSTLFLS